MGFIWKHVDFNLVLWQMCHFDAQMGSLLAGYCKEFKTQFSLQTRGREHLPSSEAVIPVPTDLRIEVIIGSSFSALSDTPVL